MFHIFYCDGEELFSWNLVVKGSLGFGMQGVGVGGRQVGHIVLLENIFSRSEKYVI